MLSVNASTELTVFSEHQRLRDQRSLYGTTVDLPVDQADLQDVSFLFNFNEMFIPVIYSTFLLCFQRKDTCGFSLLTFLTTD